MTDWLTQSFTLAEALPIATMALLLLLAIASFLRADRRVGKRANDIRTSFFARFGLEAVPQPWANLALALWVALLLALGGGAFATIVTLPFVFDPSDTDSLRWTLLTLTALTGALGAVIALPFTLIRIRQTQKQTDQKKKKKKLIKK